MVDGWNLHLAQHWMLVMQRAVGDCERVYPAWKEQGKCYQMMGKLENASFSRSGCRINSFRILIKACRR